MISLICLVIVSSLCVTAQAEAHAISSKEKRTDPGVPNCCCYPPNPSCTDECIPFIPLTLCQGGAACSLPPTCAETPCCCYPPGAQQGDCIQMLPSMCSAQGGQCDAPTNPTPPPAECCCNVPGNPAEECLIVDVDLCTAPNFCNGEAPPSCCCAPPGGDSTTCINLPMTVCQLPNICVVPTDPPSVFNFELLAGPGCGPVATPTLGPFRAVEVNLELVVDPVTGLGSLSGTFGTSPGDWSADVTEIGLYLSATGTEVLRLITGPVAAGVQPIALAPGVLAVPNAVTMTLMTNPDAYYVQVSTNQFPAPGGEVRTMPLGTPIPCPSIEPKCGANSPAPIVIDSFDIINPLFASIPLAPGPLVESFLTTSIVVGGNNERDAQLSISAPGGQAGASVITEAGGTSLVVFSSDAGTNARLLFQYDGSDGSMSRSISPGFGTIDLTQGGSSNVLRVRVGSSNNEYVLKLSIFDEMGGAEQHASPVIPAHSGTPINYDFEFQTDVPSRASAIELSVETQNTAGTDLKFEQFLVQCQSCSDEVTFEEAEFVGASLPMTTGLIEGLGLPYSNTYSISGSTGEFNVGPFPAPFNFGSGIVSSGAGAINDVITFDFVGANDPARLFSQVEMTEFLGSIISPCVGSPVGATYELLDVNMMPFMSVGQQTLIREVNGPDYWTAVVPLVATGPLIRGVRVTYVDANVACTGAGGQPGTFAGIGRIRLSAPGFCPSDYVAPQI